MLQRLLHIAEGVIGIANSICRSRLAPQVDNLPTTTTLRGGGFVARKRCIAFFLIFFGFFCYLFDRRSQVSNVRNAPNFKLRIPHFIADRLVPQLRTLLALPADVILSISDRVRL